MNPVGFGASFARAARRDDGFTMIELVWVMVLSLVVFGAVMSVLIASLHQTTENLGHVSANDAVTRTLERVTREIREATQVSGPSGDGSTITLHEYVANAGAPPATLHTVTWNCSAADTQGHHFCTRQDVTAGTGAVTQITGLTTGDVFRPQALPTGSSAAYAPVVVWLAQAIPGAPDVQLNEEVTPRNCQNEAIGACDNG